MRYLLAVDPGDTTGWAIYDYDIAELSEWGQASRIEFPDLLLDFANRTDHTPVVVVVEDFRVFRKQAAKLTGSPMMAAVVIGQVEQFIKTMEKVFKLKIKYVLQQPSVLPIASRWTGLKQPGNHKESHEIDAINHGFYYLRNNEHRGKTALERKLHEEITGETNY